MADRKGDGKIDRENVEDTTQGSEQGAADSSVRRADQTRSGQEATNDAPRDHSEEHHSNYGGGGANGGASKA